MNLQVRFDSDTYQVTLNILDQFSAQGNSIFLLVLITRGVIY